MKRKTKRILKDFLVVTLAVFFFPLCEALVHGNISLLAFGAYILNLYCLTA